MSTELKAVEKISKYLFRGLIVGFSLGILSLVVFRFVSYRPDIVHHHANFALYINGHRDEFKNFTFYEEVQACSADDKDNVKARVHMHNQVNHLVHVHDHAVTWSQFFTNLGYSLDDSAIKTDNGVFIDGKDSNKLTFVLNGEQVNNIDDRLIGSGDTLLINYGRDDEATLRRRFAEVPRDAHDANAKPDPASCSGAKDLPLVERVKKAFTIWE